MRRKIGFTFLIILVVIFSFSFCFAQAKKQKVVFQLPWMEDSINFAQYFWGDKIFEKHGLDVEIKSTKGGSPYAVKMLAAGNADFGIANPAYLVTATNSFKKKGQDLNVKVVAPVMRTVPAGFAIRKGMAPQDIRRVAIKVGSIHQIMAKVLFTKLGVPVDEIEWISVAGGWDGIKRFMTDQKIDATFTYIDGMMNIDKKGIPFDFVLLKDSGINLLGASVMVNSAQDKKTVENIVAAMMEINKFAKAKPAKIIDHYLGRYPHKAADRDLIVRTYTTMINLFDPASIPEDCWRDTSKLLLEAEQIKETYQSSLYYSDKYLK